MKAFCSLFPQRVVGPLAGAWIDKQDKRRWLIGVHSLLAVQSFVLAAGSWSDTIGSPFIVAMALNAMLFNAGRFAGLLMAGLVLEWMPEAVCFLFNGLSFLAVVFGLMLIRGTPIPRASGSVGEVFRDGLVYARRSPPVRHYLAILVALNLTASAYTVLLPIFALDVFSGDARTLGWLWGAAGCGAFASTIFLASRHSYGAILQGVAVGVSLGALALVAMGASPWLPLSMACMAVLGFGISVCNVGVLMLLQASTAEQFRGRMVSFFTSTRFGFDALGGLAAGLVAVHPGPRLTIALEGGLLLGFAIFLWLSRQRLATQIDTAVAVLH